MLRDFQETRADEYAESSAPDNSRMYKAHRHKYLGSHETAGGLRKKVTGERAGWRRNGAIKRGGKISAWCPERGDVMVTRCDCSLAEQEKQGETKCGNSRYQKKDADSPIRAAAGGHKRDLIGLGLGSSRDLNLLTNLQ